MKKFIIKTIALFIPVSVMIISVNYYADPANLFSDNYVKKIASLLGEYKYVNNVANYDDRKFLKYYFSINENKKYDTIIFGSSRSMQIGSELFNGRSIFNCSVSGAIINDYISILEVLKENKIEYNSVIIGSDPWIFNRNEKSKRFYSLIDYYSKTDSDVSVGKIKLQQTMAKLQELLSLSYFQESLLFLIKSDNAIFPGNTRTAFQSIRNDGLYSYSEKFINSDPEKRIVDAKKYAKRKYVYSLKDYKKLDRRFVEKYETFIDYFVNSKKRVLIFLPPYHPETFKILVLRDDTRIIVDAENLIRLIAEKKGIRVIGSYNPEKYGLTNQDFYDAMHPTDGAVKKIFQSELIIKK